MKKTKFFMLAAASLFAFTACNNKTEGGQAGSDSAAVENQAETATEVTVGTEGSCTAACAKFSVEVPAGWKVLKLEEEEIRIGLGDDHTKDAQVGISARFNKWETAVENQGKHSEQLGEKSFGDNTFVTFQDDSHFVAFMKVDDMHFLGANTWNVPADDATLATILSSVKVK